MDKIYEIVSQPISEWLKTKGIDISKDIILILLIVFGITVTFLIKKFYSILKRTLQNKQFDLHPYFTKEEVRNAQQNYISQKFQNVPPSKEDELSYTHSSVAKQRIIKFFLKAFSDKIDKRFFIVFADSGMGKTTFSINLFVKYHSIWRVLFKKNKYSISLIPLGHENADEHIDKLKGENKHHKTILILDALDEDKQAILNNQNRIESLIEKTKDFRIVIVTSRTQLFLNENLEPSITSIPRLGTKKGYYEFEKLYISPFTDKDVNKYINKKYGLISLRPKEKKKAKRIVKGSPYLMARPMLLDFIEDIVKSKSDFNYGYEIYESLINSWLERETNNVIASKKFTFKEDLKKFSIEVAREIYDRRRQEGYTIHHLEFEKIARKNNLDLDEFEMKTRSLLNRNPDGDFKFSHKSILEYFLALEIYRHPDFKKRFDEEGMDVTIQFYDELCQSNDFKSFHKAGKVKKCLKLYIEGNIVNNFNPKKDLLSITKIEVSNFSEENIRALRAFKNIRVLKIKDSNIKSLDDINCFQSLEELSIYNSEVKNLRRISQINLLAKLELRKVNLRNFELNEINWKMLKKLVQLNISNNKLNDIDGLKDLEDLKILKASSNQLSYFKNCNGIEVLNLDRNNIEEVNLVSSHLSKLNLAKNKLKKIDISRTGSLLELDLSGNSKFELVLAENHNLEILKLSNTKIEDDYLESFKVWKDIADIDISQNKIKSLKFLKDTNRVKELNIRETDIKKVLISDIPETLKKINISDYQNVDNLVPTFKLNKDNHTLERL